MLKGTYVNIVGKKKSEIGIGVEKIHLIFSGKKNGDIANESEVTNFQREDPISESALDFPPAEDDYMIF